MRLLIKGLAGEWMRMDATFGVGHLQKPIYTPQDNLLNINRDRERTENCNAKGGGKEGEEVVGGFGNQFRNAHSRSLRLTLNGAVDCRRTVAVSSFPPINFGQFCNNFAAGWLYMRVTSIYIYIWHTYVYLLGL